jgi:hypothetical protein
MQGACILSDEYIFKAMQLPHRAYLRTCLCNKDTARFWYLQILGRVFLLFFSSLRIP